jgi:hypothetical protein
MARRPRIKSVLLCLYDENDKLIFSESYGESIFLSLSEAGAGRQKYLNEVVKIVPNGVRAVFGKDRYNIEEGTSRFVGFA